jgi:hypothetical protein
MGKLVESLTDKEIKFIRNAKIFFVATAPLSADHHVNVSPKANKGNACVVLGPHEVGKEKLICQML